MPTIKGIVNRKVQSGVVHYKVRYTAKSVPDQWMPAPELDGQLIEVFEAKRAAKKRGQSQQGVGEGGSGEASAKRARLSEASAAETAAAAAGQAGGSGSAKATTPGTATTPAAAAAPADLGPAVSELLGGSELEEVTKKKVRRMLEERLGLETNSLDARKSEISLAVDRWVKQQEVVENEAAAGGDDDEDDDEDEDGSSSDSSGSESESGDERAQAAAQAKATKPKVTVRTVSGKEAPKQLAKLQQSLMRTSKFLATAGDVEVRVLASASLCVPACVSACQRVFRAVHAV
jgi:hypothetical protein